MSQQGFSGLFLDKLSGVSETIAGVLATHCGGGLSLKGISELSAGVAKKLVKHPFIALDGVESLSDRVADVLAAHTGGTLSLKGLKDVSAKAASALRENTDIELPERFAHPPHGAIMLPLSKTIPNRDEEPLDPQAAHARIVKIISEIARLGEEALGRQ